MEAKKWYMSKTFWLGIITIAGGIVEYLYGLPEGVSIATIVMGIINIIVRFYTNQPIGQ